MASMSSSSHMKRYHVFTSFHGPDVRQGFLSHLHAHFASKGITTFNDEEMERGHTIGPELIQAIRESRVSIVVLSEKYASSSWCLDELVEIFNCKEEAQGKTVIPIFYKVDPSHVKKHKGEFGRAFKKTCQGKSKEVKQRWSKALTDVATIAGEHSINSDNEANMIQKIATDVSKKLNSTPSRDFEDMVGLEAHMTKLESLLCLESDEVKMIGIWGPAGIGKSTIARALYNQLSISFRFTCFMGNLKGSTIGVDDYDSKLSMQNQLLSKILNQRDVRVHHLGAIKEWLHDQRVLIVLDDVDDLEQLEVLAKELSWFGSGSRIILTTEDKKIFKAHGINNIYHMEFPSEKEALEILCRSAFKQSSVPYGFEKLAKKVTKLCGDLPLGLRVVGSSLRGESKHEWELQLSRIETNLDRKIENILRVGYDRLLREDQSLFLHIACLFNNENVDHVSSLLADSHDVEIGLKTLAEKSLVHTNESIVMHYLLQKLGRQIVVLQSDEPGKRQFLIQVKEIRHVLENETGTGSVIGISFNPFNIGNDDNFSVGKRAFEGMHNLRYLRIIGGKLTLQIPEGMKYFPPLRLLHWDSYPRKSLPPRFQPDRLVELNMPFSNLEKLWGGIQPLPNLKRIDLSSSFELKEIPNLLNATNLETLTLAYCSSLVELPSSIRNLHKLKKLKMAFCKKLRVIPTDINLASLEEIDMKNCSRLRSFPDISMNIVQLDVGRTKIEEIPSSIRNLHKLKKLGLYLCKKLRVIPTDINLASLEEVDMSDCSQLTSFPVISMNIRHLDVGNTKIEEVPSSIRNLHKLEVLKMKDCKLLRVIPTDINLPSLEEVDMKGCGQLESFPDISSNIKNLSVKGTMIKDFFPPSMIRCWSRLEWLEIGSRSLKRLTHVPLSVTFLDLSNSDIEIIPDCVSGLPHLVDLIVKNCPKLVSIPALSPSIKTLNANECVSLKKVCFSFHNQTKRLSFYNCLQLDEEARTGIIQQSIKDYICLPGKEIPVEFRHKATGKSITIPLASGGDATLFASSRFKACFLLSPFEEDHLTISCHIRSQRGVTINFIRSSAWLSDQFPRLEHLFIFSGDLFPQRHGRNEVDVTISEIIFEFSCEDIDDKIIECGVQIMTKETEGSSREHATTTTTQMEAERKTKKQKVSR